VKNSKTLLQSETTKLEADKSILVAETAKLEASRIKVGTELAQLTQMRSEEQLKLSSTTNELQLLKREQSEKERLIQSLSDQLNKLTKENEAARSLMAELEMVRRERTELQRTNFQLRQHLAISLEHARNLVLESGRAAKALADFGSRKTTEAPMAEAASWLLAVGKWRTVYDTDFSQFSLNDFSNAVSGIIDTNHLDLDKK
jgi:hypothetical protein